MPWKSIKDVVKEQVALLPVGTEFTTEELFRSLRPRKDISILRVARALTQMHELVSYRDSSHRLASFSQQSQRYVKQADRDVVCPQSIIDSSDGAEYEFYKAIDGCFNAYERLLAIGVPKEDARYVLPGAVLTNIVTTMNARELMHFFSLRCCNRAQKEIRDLANAMLAEVKAVAPKIFEKAGASCVQLGYCPEHKCCGKAPTLDDLWEAWWHARDAKVVAKLNGGDEE